MYRELLHIWGPFSINSFGLCIALGLALFITLLRKHPSRKIYLSDDQLFQAFFIGIIATLTGGRLLYIFESWHTFEHVTDLFALWNGGLSILGGIISCIGAIILYFRYLGVPAIPFLDIAALYAPLAQAFGRIGCFMAGCCHGIAYQGWCAITYTDPNSFAPQNISLHPTQLYSALIFLSIFAILRFTAHRFELKTGSLLLLYLTLSSTERFVVDFWRADREFLGSAAGLFSLHQWIALGIAVTSMLLLALTSYSSQTTARHEPI